LETVEEAGLKEGDKITVKLMEIDSKTGKYKLSHRVLIPKPEGYVERERRPRPERPERAERPERNNNRNNGRNNGNNNAHRNNNHNRNNNRNEMYHDPLAEHEPKDFNDSLDHDDMV
jgi:polyribonucleotide nucleotidyltransferase